MVRMDPAWIDARGIASGGRDCLASMGIYLFNRDFLLEVLKKTDYRDFGKEVFPAAIRSRHVQVHLFDGYWEDIGTIRSFYDANLGLAQPEPAFDWCHRRRRSTRGLVFCRQPHPRCAGQGQPDRRRLPHWEGSGH